MALNLSSTLLIILLGVALILPSYAQEKPDDYLKPQNEARAQYTATPLAWDAKLAESAQTGANQHVKDCKVDPSDGPKNLFKGLAEHSTGYVNAQWIAEKYFYDVKSGNCSSPNKYCGNFANIINSKFSKVGCAKAKCNDGTGVIFECDFQ